MLKEICNNSMKKNTENKRKWKKYIQDKKEKQKNIGKNTKVNTKMLFLNNSENFLDSLSYHKILEFVNFDENRQKEEMTHRWK